MTKAEFAGALRRIAEALDKLPMPSGAGMLFKEHPMLQGEYAIGAAALWSYLRDLFTATEKEMFSRAEILVLLDQINQDPDICVPNTFYQIAELEDDDVDA